MMMMMTPNRLPTGAEEHQMHPKKMRRERVQFMPEQMETQMPEQMILRPEQMITPPRPPVCAKEQMHPKILKKRGCKRMMVSRSINYPEKSVSRSLLNEFDCEDCVPGMPVRNLMEIFSTM